jgi:hypothetical protein
MKQFVFIFRKGARELSPEELNRRNDEIRAWAGALNKEGHKLDPRVRTGELPDCFSRRERCAGREAGDKPVVPGGQRLQ